MASEIALHSPVQSGNVTSSALRSWQVWPDSWGERGADFWVGGWNWGVSPQQLLEGTRPWGEAWLPAAWAPWQDCLAHLLVLAGEHQPMGPQWGRAVKLPPFLLKAGPGQSTC